MRGSFLSLASKKSHSRQVAGIAVTVLVITMLLLSGPTNAFDLTLSAVSDSTPNQGDIITFTASVEILENELVPVSNLSINFSDGTNCVFEIDGDALTPAECAGLTITPDEATAVYGAGNMDFNFSSTPYDYGIGAGFGYADPDSGILSYNISLNTSLFPLGTLTSP